MNVLLLTQIGRGPKYDLNRVLESIKSLYTENIILHVETENLNILSHNRYRVIIADKDMTNLLQTIQNAEYTIDIRISNEKYMVLFNDNWEIKYLKLVANIISQTFNPNRSVRGTEYVSITGITLKANCFNNTLPILTLRKIAFKLIVQELIWMLSGSTDSKILERLGNKIWSTHSKREYLDSIGLTELPEGEIGKGYGYQFRQFGGKCDQLRNCIEGLTDPKLKYSRRHYISLWNPTDLGEIALPPCHLGYQFIINQNELLDLIITMRSWDILVGWNMTFAGIFLILIAKLTGNKPGTVTLNVGDCHIYANNFDAAKLILSSYDVLYNQPQLQIDDKVNWDFINSPNYESLDELFVLKDYKFNEKIKVKFNVT